MNQSIKNLGFVLLVLFSISAMGEESVNVPMDQLEKFDCPNYLVDPFIISGTLNCGAGDEENFKKSACFGVLDCTAQIKGGDSTRYKVPVKAACTPIKGTTFKLEDAYCPSAYDCLRSARIEPINPKGIIAEPNNLTNRLVNSTKRNVH